MTHSFKHYVIYDRKSKQFYRRGIACFSKDPRVYVRQEDASWRMNDIYGYRGRSEFDLVVVPAYVEVEIDESPAGQ